MRIYRFQPFYDLVDLIRKQIKRIKKYKGEVFNVGGSRFSNLSLAETTELCRMITGNNVSIGRDLHNRPADVMWLITDNGNTEREFGWKPKGKPKDILADIYGWLCEHGGEFKGIL